MKAKFMLVPLAIIASIAGIAKDSSACNPSIAVTGLPYYAVDFAGSCYTPNAWVYVAVANSSGGDVGHGWFVSDSSGNISGEISLTDCRSDYSIGSSWGPNDLPMAFSGPFTPTCTM
jgi:hypothetical protein